MQIKFYMDERHCDLLDGHCDNAIHGTTRSIFSLVVKLVEQLCLYHSLPLPSTTAHSSVPCDKFGRFFICPSTCKIWGSKDIRKKRLDFQKLLSYKKGKAEYHLEESLGPRDRDNEEVTLRVVAGLDGRIVHMITDAQISVRPSLEPRLRYTNLDYRTAARRNIGGAVSIPVGISHPFGVTKGRPQFNQLLAQIGAIATSPVTGRTKFVCCGATPS